jgi:hypothetical protein
MPPRAAAQPLSVVTSHSQKTVAPARTIAAKRPEAGTNMLSVVPDSGEMTVFQVLLLLRIKALFRRTRSPLTAFANKDSTQVAGKLLIVGAAMMS